MIVGKARNRRVVRWDEEGKDRREADQVIGTNER